jgi:hypothetical protein
MVVRTQRIYDHGGEERPSAESDKRQQSAMHCIDLGAERPIVACEGGVPTHHV